MPHSVTIRGANRKRQPELGQTPVEGKERKLMAVLPKGGMFPKVYPVKLRQKK